MKFFILGGTGFIGGHLISYLSSNNHSIKVLVRKQVAKENFPNNCQLIQGNPLTPGSWQNIAAQCDCIVNLVGKNIFNMWTEKTKKNIYDTRIISTRLAVQALAESNKNGPCLINANAVGYYPGNGNKILTEHDEIPGDNFLAQVCVAWQKEALQGKEFDKRVVVTRFAPVLAKDGGALAQLLPVFRLGLGGRIGNGKQYFPWIHIYDLVRAIEFAAISQSIQGPVNLIAPETITNAHFTKILAKTLNRPAFFTIPRGILRIIFGELSEMFVKGPQVMPYKLIENNFEFCYPTIQKALNEILID